MTKLHNKDHMQSQHLKDLVHFHSFFGDKHCRPVNMGGALIGFCNVFIVGVSRNL